MKKGPVFLTQCLCVISLNIMSNRQQIKTSKIPRTILQLPYFRYSGASKNLDFDENGQAVLENIDRVTRIYPLAVPKHEM